VVGRKRGCLAAKGQREGGSNLFRGGDICWGSYDNLESYVYLCRCDAWL
jgi:hypothetical protein